MVIKAFGAGALLLFSTCTALLIAKVWSNKLGDHSNSQEEHWGGYNMNAGNTSFQGHYSKGEKFLLSSATGFRNFPYLLLGHLPSKILLSSHSFG